MFLITILNHNFSLLKKCIILYGFYTFYPYEYKKILFHNKNMKIYNFVKFLYFPIIPKTPNIKKSIIIFQ